jgi:hypothetical protein
MLLCRANWYESIHRARKLSDRYPPVNRGNFCASAR